MARAVRIRWTTPAILRAALTGCLALTIALGALCSVVPLHTGGSWNTIKQQLAPQVRDASSLYLALTDMDAQTANILVFGDNKSLASQRAKANTIYGQDLHTASTALQGATVSAGSNASAQATLVQILDGLGLYEALSSRATSLNDEARAPSGRPSPDALDAYRRATDLMRTQLLPSAQKLIDANNSAFTSTYGDERGLLSDVRLAALALGLLTLAALVALQLFLARRFRRRINPALAAATLLCLTVIGTTFSLAGDERYELYYTRHEAFDSVVALSSARALGYDANADESRNILDPAMSGQYSNAFLEKSQQIADLSGADLATYSTRIAAARRAYLANHDDVRFTGYLGAEFRNLTFTGERAAAEKILSAWVQYQGDDHTTRGYLAAGQLDRAIDYNTSYAVGGSNWAFDQWDAAMQVDIAINADAFSSGVSDGEGELDTGLVVIAVATAAALALAVIGVRPRLAEFR
ncbi:hypothetical protein NGB36_11765 [Streptomyces sp. RB6PN25]|uniref:Secreted protein n=1 Tax=Streptomyces humicola TaxID=2953240 RepID=A0ABT1PUA9_9ACTN|nr:hypothetical protein [Streptomyces humicola]MCQ4081258.1 hypothetical protein [Streptomyces humicola]